MSKENILVIDDEEVICNLLKDALSEEGYKVTAVQEAEEGLKIARDGCFHLIITDLKMPRVGGTEIIRRVRKFNIDNVVVVITAYPSFETVREALRLGAYDYITKPFDLREISFTVKRAIEFRHLSLERKRLLEELKEENVILEKRVEERTRDLKGLYHKMQLAYMATIKALAQALEARDHYTHTHSQKVTRYAVDIARQIGLSKPEIETLKEACQLHDLGKIGVHDYILNKTGGLTEEEWEEIKLHSSKGADILGPLTFLKDVIVLIRQHHERYDGRGYPDGLKGEEIKLGARIIAVADAFDAMTSDRPYRKGHSREYAISQLKQGSGRQFDPRIVRAFLSVLNEAAT
ncbi:MAG: HD domain-containing phosphohydrolase [Candidatus Omnitrophota bacterium]